MTTNEIREALDTLHDRLEQDKLANLGLWHWNPTIDNLADYLTVIAGILKSLNERLDALEKA